MAVRSAASDYKSFVLALSSLVVLFACADLVGWWFHIPILTSLVPHYATMKPNTALCLALLAFAAMGRIGTSARDRPDRPWIVAPTATLSLLVSGASLAEYITHRSFGLDQVLASVPMERFADPAGRMSIGAAGCLFLTSAALLLLDRLPRSSVGLLLAGLTASFSGLVGFLFQSGPLIDVFWFKSLAVHTALGLLLVQTAALATRPDREPFSSLVQPRRPEGNRRFLLFAVLLLPLGLGLPILAGGMQARLYDARYAFALLVVLLVAVQTLVLWADSLALDRVEAVLRESEAESSRILHSIGDAVIVTDIDAHVVRMNPLAQQLTGWTLAEAHGKDLSDIFDINSEVTGEPVENPVDKVKRSGTVVGLANHTLLRHRDGHTTHIDDSSAPIRNESGGLTGIVLVFRNVDERKQSEERLLASDKKLRVALDAARLGAWELDLATGEVDCSAICKANFGRSPEEPFSYHDLEASIHPEDRHIRTETILAAIETGQVYRGEYRVVWPDGSLHWLISHGQVFTGDSGLPTRIAGVILDVTERHRTATALLQNEKLAAVGRLAASIAHEINNPLEAVTNLLFLIRTNAESPTVRDYIATAERELQRIAVITTQTLRFHKQSTNPKPVTFDDLLATVLSIYQGKLINARVHVERRERATRPVLCFDGEIRQVLSNLVGNAIDAMPSGGRLLLRSREAIHWPSARPGLLITVADTGNGMSAQTAAHLFEPFYTTKGIAGTGLGLWISHEIVARHHGTLRLRSSRQPGHSGTVFTLFLPWDTALR